MEYNGIFEGQKDKDIYVFFGGKIAVGVGSYDKTDEESDVINMVVMELSELEESMPIGANDWKPEIGTLKDQPNVKLIFDKIESIDVVINGLTKMKEWLK